MSTRPDERVRTAISYEFGWHDYARDTQRDFLSHRASYVATLDNVVFQNLRLEFGDQYLQTNDNNVLDNEVVQRVYAREHRWRQRIGDRSRFAKQGGDQEQRAAHGTGTPAVRNKRERAIKGKPISAVGSSD